MSRPAISKALKAASLIDKLIALFTDVNLLSHTNYSLLDKVMNFWDVMSTNWICFSSVFRKELSMFRLNRPLMKSS
ncbi:TPA: hypothetical protein I7724_06720 [Vibrio vulnificus]|nr:hypothetical protein [Vibrio vulnificus]